MRIRMLDGFNESWIDFELDEAQRLKGTVDLDTAIRKVAEGAK